MSKLKTDFLTKENVELLWEIILDDEGIKRIHDINNPNFQNFFINQVRGFHHSGIQDLMNMNKMFITNIIDIATTSVKEKEKEKELITYENIQTDRQTKFDNEYKQKAFEFQDAIKLVVPEQLDFTEKKDIPITEMERLISETIAQRNFDINKILKDVPPPPLNQPKQQQQQQQQKNQQQIKYIKIDKNNLNINNEVIDLQPKKVSWNNEVEEIEVDEEKVPNIFSKLKLIPQKVENNIDFFIDEVPNELSETIKKLDSLATDVAKILNILEKLNMNNIII